MMESKIKNITIDREKILAIISIFLFLFMMIFHLTHSALWGDEWVEYIYSQAGIRNGDLYEKIISTFQPPLYNFLMHFWLKVSSSILWFRFFNVILGSISGVFLFKTVSLLCDRKTAWVALIVLSASYQWIFCIQECSEYALMLCGLFGAIYFYVICSQSFQYRKMILFLLFSVMAIYSQYGAVFVALPLLLIFFLREFFSDSSIKKRAILLLSYAISFVFFAIPLLHFFVRKQMDHNQIGSNTVPFTAVLLKDLPFTLGKIIGYFYHLNAGTVWPVILGIFSVFLLAVSVIIVLKGRLDWSRRSLIICLWITYLTHYYLVQRHIYAMVHPNQSAGFFGRYSYFYIPLLCAVLPVIFTELKKYVIKKKKFRLKVVSVCLIAVVIFGLGVSWITTLKNWNKALDNQFAKIWIAHDGWKNVTYLYGIAKYGFQYYVSHSPEYQEGYLNQATDKVDNNNLPGSFWAWSSNWAGNSWQETIDAARDQGYSVIIYNDSGNTGQLAYCTME